jgi:hypothetical protein
MSFGTTTVTGIQSQTWFVHFNTDFRCTWSRSIN